MTLVVIRISFGFLFFSPFILKTGITHLKTKNFLSHFLRASLISTAMFCTYYAYAHLPLALATAVGFTGPLITVLLASFIFKERISLGQWFALILGYLGVLLMIQPGAFVFNRAVLISLLGNGVTSCVVILTKHLSKTESTLQIMSYSTFLSFVLVVGILSWNISLPNPGDLFLLALGGGLGILSQFCYIQALKYGEPSIVAPFEYIRLVFMIPLGYFLFDESISPLTLGGSFIIIATTYYITASKSEKLSFATKY
jgi:drug/metabolite transporter (DMT)-like permease